MLASEPLNSAESHSRTAAVHRWICRYWLAAGFVFFVCGLFIAPDRHDYKVALNYLMMLPGLIAACFVARWWPAAVRQRALLLPVAAYLMYMAANACLQNREEGLAFVQWAAYIAIFVVAVGLCLEMSAQRIAQVLWLGAVAASAAALYAVFLDFSSGVIRHPEYRLSGYGALYNPLRSGHLFGAFFIVAIWCALLAPLAKVQRALAVLCGVVQLIALLLTGSRSPLLALLVVALLIVATVPKSRGWRYCGFFLLAAGMTLLGFGERLIARGWSLRPELWQLTLAQVAERPWFGAGLGNQILLNASNGVPYYDTHNIFLAALYYGGGVGLLLFAACFGAGFRVAWSRRSRAPQFWIAALLQVFGIATLQFDGGSLIGRPTEFWILYWLPIALTLQALREPADSGGDTAHAR